MRQYRGLTKEGKLVYGWSFMLDGLAYIIPLSDNFHTPSSFVCNFVEVIPKTVEQQVGIKDKNGTEYYEDSLVKGIKCRYAEGDSIGRVYYNKFHSAYWVSACDDSYNVPLGLETWWTVVGDIHTTPKLMEKENDSKNTRQIER